MMGEITYAIFNPIEGGYICASVDEKEWKKLGHQIIDNNGNVTGLEKWANKRIVIFLDEGC